MDDILLSDSLYVYSVNKENYPLSYNEWNLSYLIGKALLLNGVEFESESPGYSMKFRGNPGNNFLIRFRSLSNEGFNHDFEFINPLLLFIQTLYGNCDWDYEISGTKIDYINFRFKI